MTVKVKVTLLVEVDTEDDEQCGGDPLEENCVLNMVNNGSFLCPVDVLDVCYYKEED